MSNAKQTVSSTPESVQAQIYAVHNQMRDRCLAAGISEQHYKSVLNGIEDASLETLQDVLVWLTAFYEGPYQDMYAIWRLKPADWWKNMETLFQQRKTREQKLLKTEYKKLRKAWYKRNGQEQDQEPVENETAESTT